VIVSKSIQGAKPSWIPGGFPFFSGLEGAGVNAVQWTAEPTLTEPAGENRAPEGVPNPLESQEGFFFWDSKGRK